MKSKAKHILMGLGIAVLMVGLTVLGLFLNAKYIDWERDNKEAVQAQSLCSAQALNDSSTEIMPDLNMQAMLSAKTRAVLPGYVINHIGFKTGLLEVKSFDVSNRVMEVVDNQELGSYVFFYEKNLNYIDYSYYSCDEGRFVDFSYDLKNYTDTQLTDMYIVVMIECVERASCDTCGAIDGCYYLAVFDMGKNSEIPDPMTADITSTPDKVHISSNKELDKVYFTGLYVPHTGETHNQIGQWFVTADEDFTFEFLDIYDFCDYAFDRNGEYVFKFNLLAKDGTSLSVDYTYLYSLYFSEDMVSITYDTENYVINIVSERELSKTFATAFSAGGSTVIGYLSDPYVLNIKEHLQSFFGATEYFVTFKLTDIYGQELSLRHEFVLNEFKSEDINVKLHNTGFQLVFTHDEFNITKVIMCGLENSSGFRAYDENFVFNKNSYGNLGYLGLGELGLNVGDRLHYRIYDDFGRCANYVFTLPAVREMYTNVVWEGVQLEYDNVNNLLKVKSVLPYTHYEFESYYYGHSYTQVGMVTGELNGDLDLSGVDGGTADFYMVKLVFYASNGKEHYCLYVVEGYEPFSKENVEIVPEKGYNLTFKTDYKIKTIELMYISPTSSNGQEIIKIRDTFSAMTINIKKYIEEYELASSSRYIFAFRLTNETGRTLTINYNYKFSDFNDFGDMLGETAKNIWDKVKDFFDSDGNGLWPTILKWLKIIGIVVLVIICFPLIIAVLKLIVKAIAGLIKWIGRQINKGKR